MRLIQLNVHDKILSVFDFRNAITDFSKLQMLDIFKNKPDFIPKINPVFLKTMRYRIPFVKIDSETYIFPLNMKNHTKHCVFEDYIDLCVADLDFLIFIENYFYEIAKAEYAKNPAFGLKTTRFPNGKIVNAPYKRNFTRRVVRSSNMNFVEYNLAKIIQNNDEKAIWAVYAELKSEIYFKENDFDLAQAEQMTGHLGNFTQGQLRSYGRLNTDNSLLAQYGILVKLQSGENITPPDLRKISQLIHNFYATFGDLSAICTDYSLLIAYSGDKKMYAKKHAIGVFISVFKAIGVSDISNAAQTFAHEMAHFIDFYLGEKYKRTWFSDDNNSIAGVIAAAFRKNMTQLQTSRYQNQTKECFARAFEQYFSLKNNIPIDNSFGNFCENTFFMKTIAPLIEKLLQNHLYK
jgi:hypothetical protein